MIIKKLTIVLIMKIQLLCVNFSNDCENEMQQCYLDDIYTINQCKTEYLTDKYGERYVESN